MNVFRLAATTMAVLVADVLFVYTFVVNDHVYVPFLVVVGAVALLASSFMIYSYCYSSNAGNLIYLVEIVLYTTFSILFFFQRKLGILWIAVATGVYITLLCVMYVLFKISNNKSNDKEDS